MADEKTTSTNPNAKPSDGKAAKAAAADPLAGVPTAGESDAGGAEQLARLVTSDPHAHEAIPAANGPEAIGSGQPLPEAAVSAMDERREAGVPEPPKVGPIENVDLYDTPGGYQAVPAGLKPSDLAAGEIRHPGVSKTTVESSDEHSDKVAGSGTRTAGE